MEKLEPKAIERCRRLRQEGNSPGEISFATRLSKSALYGHVKDIVLTAGQKEDIQGRTGERNPARVNPRKGRRFPGREIRKPELWSDDLVHITAHYMFDGRIDAGGLRLLQKR
ncbi:MAG: hypothetical protein PHT59_05810 [Candidatus Omnitrophica bacterium]|nr:hypothetical protein [Candidatus Omnitrophota bacterium]